MADKDNKNVEFETVPETAAAADTGKAVPVEQKVINPPSGIVALIILIILCFMVPVLFISGATAWPLRKVLRHHHEAGIFLRESFREIQQSGLRFAGCD